MVPRSYRDLAPPASRPPETTVALAVPLPLQTPRDSKSDERELQTEPIRSAQSQWLASAARPDKRSLHTLDEPDPIAIGIRELSDRRAAWNIHGRHDGLAAKALDLI